MKSNNKIEMAKSDKNIKLKLLVDTITPPLKINKSDYLEVGLYPIIDQSKNFIAGWTNDPNSLIKPPPGGLIIFGDHTCAIKFIETPFAQGADGIKILKTKGDLIPAYLYAYLLAFPLLNDGYKRHFSDLKEMEILVPSAEIQKDVAELLTTLNSKISHNKEIATTMEEIANTFFKSWFIDFDPTNALDHGIEVFGIPKELISLFKVELADSEIGPIPSGWTVSSLDETFDVGIGRTPPRKEPEWFCSGDEGVKWVSIRDMGNYSTFSNETLEGLTEKAVVKFRVPIVPEDTVLMSFKLTVGKICITDTELTTNEAIAHFKVKTGSDLGTNFLYLWLKNFDMNKLDSTSSIGNATNSTLVKQIRILIPDSRIVAHFNSIIDPLFLRIRKLNNEILLIEELRNSILPKAISGRIPSTAEVMAS